MNEEELAYTKQHYVEEVAVFFETEGLPRMYGRVLGHLLICDPPQQSSAQLAEALQASRGAISTATRALLQAQLISRAPRPGERSMYFEILPDAFDKLLLGATARLRVGCDLSRRGLHLVEQLGSDPTRLRNFSQLLEFMAREYPALLSRWSEYQQTLSKEDR